MAPRARVEIASRNLEMGFGFLSEVTGRRSKKGTEGSRGSGEAQTHAWSLSADMPLPLHIIRQTFGADL